MSDSENDIDREVEEILEKMEKKGGKKVKPEPEEEEVKPKKKRKPRGPASDKQKKALEDGRRRRQQDVEISRLERDKKRGDNEKKLTRLKKEKAARDETMDGGKDDKVSELQKQIEELKQNMGKSNQPIINVHAAAPLTAKAVDPQQDALEKQLRKYIKY